MSEQDKHKMREAKEVASALSENLDLSEEVVAAIPDDDIQQKVGDAIELGTALRDAEQAVTDE
jgi:hypothetical protein